MPKRKPVITITQTEFRADPGKWGKLLEKNDVAVKRDGTEDVVMYVSTGSLPRSLWERLKAAWEAFQYQ